MTRPIDSSFARAAIVVLVLAVLFCLVLPMSGDGMGMPLALFCCFVLAVALAVFVLARPRTSLMVDGPLAPSVPLARGPTEGARAPDILALGSLLI
jgi:peptidoglycan/LPS O-acetylase OafA/YrhL